MKEPFLPQAVIARKRDGEVLEKADIEQFVTALTQDRLSDAQVGAFAMAVFLKSMTTDECAALTLAMRDSGAVLEWDRDRLSGPIIDKHSTGGVGDCVSLMLAPMLAGCGAHVPMISGRGLGHTGGTLDKLSSIPGYDTEPETDRFKNVVEKIGCAIIGQTAQLAPADRRLYAVRDVTATVESIPLITSSILSKKLAAGLDALVMDVKTGNGAVTEDPALARHLAESIVSVAGRAGLNTVAVITDMSQPLAPAIGNALEIEETVAYLTGVRRDPRLHEVVITLGQELLLASGLVENGDEGRRLLDSALDSGEAAERFEKMVAALGGPTDLLTGFPRYLPNPLSCVRWGQTSRVRLCQWIPERWDRRWLNWVADGPTQRMSSTRPLELITAPALATQSIEGLYCAGSMHVPRRMPSTPANGFVRHLRSVCRLRSTCRSCARF